MSRSVDREGPSGGRGGPVRVATIGAAFSANKGAASMLQSVIDNLPGVLGRPCHFDVLTTYPREDGAALGGLAGSGAVRIVSYRPAELLFRDLPLALLAAVARSLGASGRRACVTPSLASLARADVVVDLAGISFSRGRGVPLLVYNALMTGIPLLVGARVVKCAQAIGPLDGALTRLAGRVVLPRLEAVVARGAETEGHLRSMGLENVRRAADLAFALRPGEADQERAAALLASVAASAPAEGPVCVVPSTVVLRMCQSRGIDYTAILVDFIRERIENGTPVLLLPHAVRPGRPASRMNDIPLVRDIHGRVGSSRCVLIDDDLSPGTLRALIEGSSLLVTSRFHALISSLCVGTPPLVVGWSHKYEEVMNEIGLREWMIPHESLKPDLLRSRFLSLWDVRADVRSAIRARVSRLVDDAYESFRVVRDVVAASVGGAA